MFESVDSSVCSATESAINLLTSVYRGIVNESDLIINGDNMAGH